MAIHSLLHVLNNSKAKKSHRLVLIEIANHINKEGLAWPSHNTLARKTGLTRRRVVDLIADLRAVGELEVIPGGGPHGEQAYRIPCETISQGMKSSGEIFDMEGVKPFHIESNIESVYPRNQTEQEERWLTHEEAVSFGLTEGSRLYRKAVGELLPGE